MKNIVKITAVLVLIAALFGCQMPGVSPVGDTDINKKVIDVPEGTEFVEIIVGLSDTESTFIRQIAAVESIINEGSQLESLVSLERVHAIDTVEAAFQEEYNAMATEVERRIYRDFKCTVPVSQAVEIMEKLEASLEVEYVQQNYLYKQYLNPNDPYFQNGKLYGMTKTYTDDAWDLSQGEQVIVAVIDSGVDGNHPDLVNNLWKSPQGTWGYDFSDKDPYPSPNGSHGTHVAGTIGAVGNNGQGVIGVAPKVKIMAVKIFPNAYSSVCSQAIKYAVDNGARVMNNSWGPSSRQSSDRTIENAIEYAHAKNAVIVWAAGNENDDASYYYGGNSPYTINVAAVDSSFRRASFSNYGSTVDISAPGVSIYSTIPSARYSSMSGTSMAAPHVAGLAALMISKNPGLSNEDVRRIMKDTAIPVSSSILGAGVMNSLAAVRASGGIITTPTPVVTKTPTPIVTSTPIITPTATPTADPVGSTWSPSKVYNGGDRVKHAGYLWEARWWTQGDEPGADEWGPWKNLGPIGDVTPTPTPIVTVGPTSVPTATPTSGTGYPAWQLNATYTAGDIVSYNGKLYKALVSHTAYDTGWNPVSAPTLWAEL